MSQFTYNGEQAEILLHRGEEVELFPGTVVEISDVMQGNEYCKRLIDQGVLVPAPKPEPAPAPAPEPAPAPADDTEPAAATNQAISSDQPVNIELGAAPDSVPGGASEITPAAAPAPEKNQKKGSKNV